VWDIGLVLLDWPSALYIAGMILVSLSVIQFSLRIVSRFIGFWPAIAFEALAGILFVAIGAILVAFSLVSPAPTGETGAATGGLLDVPVGILVAFSASAIIYWTPYLSRLAFAIARYHLSQNGKAKK